jgi:hypothetical protein
VKEKRIHECYVCGKRDVWGSLWMTYGSIRDLEDFGFCIKVCSEPCKQKLLPDVKSVYDAEIAEFGKRPRW